MKIGSKSYKDETVFEFNIYEFIPELVPPPSTGLERFDPKSYYITSGDAVLKAEILKRDLWSYAGQVRKIFNKNPNKKLKKFEELAWKAAGGATRILNELKKARGDAQFFETEWRPPKLMLIKKNPRNRKK